MAQIVESGTRRRCSGPTQAHCAGAPIPPPRGAPHDVDLVSDFRVGGVDERERDNVRRVRDFGQVECFIVRFEEGAVNPHDFGAIELEGDDLPRGRGELGVQRLATEELVVERDVAGPSLLDRTAVELLDPVDARGYFAWTLDNFEWAWGYARRFGILRVDYDTLERRWKVSAHWYRRLIERRELPAVDDVEPAV